MTEQEKRRLIFPKDFVAAWFAELPKHQTHEQAYEAVEMVYEEYFGRRKYSSFGSFRVVRDRIYNSK